MHTEAEKKAVLEKYRSALDTVTPSDSVAICDTDNGHELQIGCWIRTRDGEPVSWLNGPTIESSRFIPCRNLEGFKGFKKIPAKVNAPAPQPPTVTSDYTEPSADALRASGVGTGNGYSAGLIQNLVRPKRKKSRAF